MRYLLLLVFAFALLAICFIILTKTSSIWHLNDAKRKGKYPTKGKATMFDVRRLLLRGEKTLAIRVYREIFGTNHEDSQKAVDELERSLK